MNKDNCYEIGYVAKSHGLHGEVLIQLDVEDASQYEEIETIFVEINNRLVPYFVEWWHLQNKGKVLIKFEEIDKIDDTSFIKGKKLFLPLEFLPTLEEGEYYLHEVIDYTVIDAQLGTLGTVKCFHTATAQTLLEMEYKDKDILIPVIDEIVQEANHEEKTLSVNMPEGLLEVYFEDDTNEQVED
ncbi:MAG: 16S rRNA processing protein RimM [Cytophagales bacterium]|nr:16S rRNA processing protein RimM [Cytophagales bacterium]